MTAARHYSPGFWRITHATTGELAALALELLDALRIADRLGEEFVVLPPEPPAFLFAQDTAHPSSACRSQCALSPATVRQHG